MFCSDIWKKVKEQKKDAGWLQILKQTWICPKQVVQVISVKVVKKIIKKIVDMY